MTATDNSREAAIARSYEAMALVDLCAKTARQLADNNIEVTADNIARVLEMAKQRMESVHDHLERGQ